MNSIDLKLLILTCFLLFTISTVRAQKDSSRSLKLSAYAEFYYSFDFSQPRQQEKAAFLYNYKRNQEVQANLILTKASYSSKRMRANLGLMIGNYARFNLSSEPGLLRYINEANIGYKLSRKYKLWVDAGIFPSHIGFESAIGSACPNLTRSMVAENSPYYESGLNVNYTTANEQLIVALWLLNGWQRIHISRYTQRPSGGLQIVYKPNTRLTLNYSNFLGSARPDSLHRFRTYHNLYVLYQPYPKLGLTAGFDIGSETGGSLPNGIWFTPIAIVRYQFYTNLKMALRGEYYQDSKQIMLTAPTAKGFEMTGLSVNVDYQAHKKLLLRIEGKWFHALESYFNSGANNYAITGCAAFSL